MKKLKVLIGCEESQTVCIEFRKLGFEAYSSDLQEFPALAIVIMAIAMVCSLIYIAQKCKELNRNGFGKKSEL